MSVHRAVTLPVPSVYAETAPHYEPGACNERRSLGSPHGLILAMVHTGYTIAVYLCFHVMCVGSKQNDVTLIWLFGLE